MSHHPWCQTVLPFEPLRLAIAYVVGIGVMAIVDDSYCLGVGPGPRVHQHFLSSCWVLLLALAEPFSSRRSFGGRDGLDLERVDRKDFRL